MEVVYGEECSHHWAFHDGKLEQFLEPGNSYLLAQPLTLHITVKQWGSWKYDFKEFLHME